MKKALTPEQFVWLCGVFFGLIVFAFWPATNCDFQFYDEAAYLLNNTQVNSGITLHGILWAFTSLDFSNWYPLTWLSHMMDFEIYGVQPWGHHLTNVLVHATNGVLLFLVLNRMTGAVWRSLVVAALFAFHPLRVESVAWISERKDVLSAMFGLIALWTYTHYVQHQESRRKFYYLTLVFFLCSLMSKAMLVTFPFVLLLLDYWPLRRTDSLRRLVIEKIPFLFLIIPVSIAAFIAEKRGGSFVLHLPLHLRLENSLVSYVRYLGKIFWPEHLAVLYPYPDSWPMSEVVLVVILLAGIFASTFALRVRWPFLIVGWLIYLGTLVPVIGIVQEGAQSMANRYTYFPMISILIIVIWGATDLLKRCRSGDLTITAMILVATCFIATRREIVNWKDGATLWSHAIAVTHKNFMAHYCLGGVYYNTDPEKSLEEYKKSVAIFPDYAEAQRNLALLSFMARHFDDAVIHFKKAIQLEPTNPWAYSGLGRTYLEMKMADDAVASLKKAIELEPDNAGYKEGLERALSATQK